MKDMIFFGDELELLNALDRAGCVLTDDGKFYCDLENDDLPFNSRLPVRIRGTYTAAQGGWEIAYSIAPAPRTRIIGAVCAALVLFSMIIGAGKGCVLFTILTAALVVNFLGQKNACLRRFQSKLLHRAEFEL